MRSICDVFFYTDVGVGAVVSESPLGSEGGSVTTLLCVRKDATLPQSSPGHLSVLKVVIGHRHSGRGITTVTSDTHFVIVP